MISGKTKKRCKRSTAVLILGLWRSGSVLGFYPMRRGFESLQAH